MRERRRLMSYFVATRAAWREDSGAPMCVRPYTIASGPDVSAQAMSRLLGEMKLFNQCLEARFGAERIGHWVHVEIQEAVIAFCVGFVEPVHRGVFFAKATMDGSKVKRGNVPRFRKKAKVRKGVACTHLITGKSERVTVQGDHDRMIAG